jgi:transmembrane sensor
MDAQRQRLMALLSKEAWTKEEKKWMLDYLESEDTRELQEVMHQQFGNDFLPNQLDADSSTQLLQDIHQKLGLPKGGQRASVVQLWKRRVAVAASVIGLLVCLAYFLSTRDVKKEVAKTTITPGPAIQDVLPGGDKAVLTLADGSTIVLDETHDGTVAQQGNTVVRKLDGKLAYTRTPANTQEILFNTIATPRGGQYQIELGDGTLVWLNAASSLRFPTAFTGNERRVEVTGEAYFEVAKKQQMPFVVSVNGAEIQVVGTHFNVMAYPEEPAIKTTLLEGAVRFVKEGKERLLKPGQQSLLTKTGDLKLMQEVDVAGVVAWKNGRFSFDGVDIGTLTRQLARWYDVEVVYKKNVNEIFYAKFPRDIKLSDALKALELTGKVKFGIDGKRIIVEP